MYEAQTVVRCSPRCPLQSPCFRAIWPSSVNQHSYFSLIILAAPTEYPASFPFRLANLARPPSGNKSSQSPVSILSLSTTSHWARILHSRFQRAHTKNTLSPMETAPCVNSVENKTPPRPRLEEGKPARCPQFAPDVSPHRGQTRRKAEHIPTKAQEQPQVAISQFDCAVKEIERAQPEIHALDEER